MSEELKQNVNETIDNATQLDDDALEKVSGGGLYPTPRRQRQKRKVHMVVIRNGKVVNDDDDDEEEEIF